MSCRGPRDSAPGNASVGCPPGVDVWGRAATAAGGVNATGASTSELRGRGPVQADGIRLVVLSACGLALLLFVYIFLQYMKQQRSRGVQREQGQGGERQSLVELTRKKVTMYEAISEDASSLCSDCPVVVLNDWSFTGSDLGAVAVGWPESRSQNSQSGRGEESSSGAPAL